MLPELVLESFLRNWLNICSEKFILSPLVETFCRTTIFLCLTPEVPPNVNQKYHPVVMIWVRSLGAGSSEVKYFFAPTRQLNVLNFAFYLSDFSSPLLWHCTQCLQLKIFTELCCWTTLSNNHFICLAPEANRNRGRAMPVVLSQACSLEDLCPLVNSFVVPTKQFKMKTTCFFLNVSSSSCYLWCLARCVGLKINLALLSNVH